MPYLLRNMRLRPLRCVRAGTPWWAWLGGIMGAFYVTTVILFARKLGPGTLQALFVTALLLTSVLLDTCGWLNFRKRPLHWGRILGTCLMLVGVMLVTYFDGTRGIKGSASAPPAAPPAAPSQAAGASHVHAQLRSQPSSETQLTRALLQPSSESAGVSVSAAPSFAQATPGASAVWLLHDDDEREASGGSQAGEAVAHAAGAGRPGGGVAAAAAVLVHHAGTAKGAAGADADTDAGADAVGSRQGGPHALGDAGLGTDAQPQGREGQVSVEAGGQGKERGRRIAQSQEVQGAGGLQGGTPGI